MGSGGSKGAAWKNQVHYEQWASDGSLSCDWDGGLGSSGSNCLIYGENWRSEIYQGLDAEDEIRRISMCLCGIEGQLVPHWYIVIKTEYNFNFSIEKNSEYIIMQRSEEKDFVMNYCLHKKRPPDIEEVEWACGKGDMGSLVNWLFDNNELTLGYTAAVRHKNCMGFAKRVWDTFAKSDPFNFARLPYPPAVV